MRKNHFTEFIPLGLLLIVGLGSTFQVWITDYVFDYRQYIGFTFLFISTILYYRNRNLYKYVFGLTLILGTFSLIAFSTYIIEIKLFFIPIQIIPFFSLIVFTIIYKKWIGDLFFGLVENTQDDEQALYQRKMARFKENFFNLSDDEIAGKLNQELLPEARKALEEIRSEREKTHYNNI